jgi:flagellar basal body-associated protein FliL
VAEDKPNDKGGEAQAPKKKLPPIVLVVVGAALGGAGTVFMLPKDAPKPVTEPAPRIEQVIHPDKVELSFNPRTNRGIKAAKATFMFVYRADLNREAEVLAQIQEHWDLMVSRSLLTLMRRTPEEILSEDGIRLLTADLVKEISLALFPKGDAVVEDIVWKQLMVQ